MGIDERAILPVAHHNLDRGPPEKILETVEARPIVQIAQDHQRRAVVQPRIDPPTQPDRLRQLLAPVGDADAQRILRRLGPMGGLGFQMRADHVKRHPFAGDDIKLERRFGKDDMILARVDIQINVQRPVKARRIPLPDRTTGRMGGRQPVRIEQQRDFLLRVIGKADHRLACAQIEMRGKAFQCGHCAAFTALVRGLDHHHSIGIHRPKHGAQSLRLLRTGDIVACRPAVIQQQLILIVEQTREPFNVIGRDPHYCALPDQVSHARLMSIMRFSAMAMASCGRPRATRASG